MDIIEKLNWENIQILAINIELWRKIEREISVEVKNFGVNPPTPMLFGVGVFERLPIV